ncbi:hypothetical protein GOP47_0000159 [Adiantum capillus-veneris]|uniref:Sel1-like protein n=1 Tax=Adiantum capillus-veneris TaxID=13818 RepID=A0A9D4VDE8_ADICA|nr:hypothetical protein GOP47_0000159 [Adiantum capillus-veneris]
MSTSPSKNITDSEMIDGKVRNKDERVRLKVVVDSCVKRWFEEYLLAAEQGDREMQSLVGAMYNTGYGVTRDPIKGKFWLDRARSGHWNHKDRKQ